MSLSLNNPLIIGDINKKIQNEIGDLQDLETVDKSSLVNALNEALDSTLNGASRDLDNLSTTGTQKLRSLNAYANEGELLTDTDGLAFVKNYAHSTFDLSKFYVTGSPNITDDGIASGFSSGNRIRTTSQFNLHNKKFSIKVKFKQDDWTSDGRLFTAPGVAISVSTDASSWTLGKFSIFIITDNGAIASYAPSNRCITKNQYNYVKFNFDGSKYTVEHSLDDKEYTTVYSLDSLESPANADRLIDIGSNISDVGYTNYIGSIDLKQFSITVDGVEVFNGNRTGIDTIKPDDYTVVGTPTISADGVASGFSVNQDCLKTTIDFSSMNSFTISGLFYRDNTTSTGLHQTIFELYDNVNNREKLFLYCPYSYRDNLCMQYPDSASSEATTHYYSFTISQWHTYDIKFENGILNLFVDGVKKTSDITVDKTWLQHSYELRIGASHNGAPYSKGFLGQIDLNAFKIYVDGNLVYQPCLKIPYTESKTGSKVVNSIYRSRVNDMAEQFGYAPYYTLDDTDFTLPQVELYGLIGQRTLRDSYRNGINYWELYSNRDLEQGGSCTSGVEVTFARPFADTNYVLSVPYSAKSATAFTPTQTGDWIAKGKGLL